MAGKASYEFNTLDMEVEITTGMTIGQGWAKVAPEFGADPQRPCTFQAGGALISKDTLLQPGQTVVATVAHDPKGA